jgi:hypothetical protein
MGTYEGSEGEGDDIIKILNFHLFYHYFYFCLTFSRWNLNQNFKIYLIIRVHSTNPKLFPWPQGSNIRMYVYLYTFILVWH